MHRSELPDDPFPRAGAVPVLVEGFGSSVGELDDDVIRSHGDAAAAAGTAIKLLGDRSDQDDLVTIVIDASTTVSSARQRRVFVHPLILPRFPLKDADEDQGESGYARRPRTERG